MMVLRALRDCSSSARKLSSYWPSACCMYSNPTANPMLTNTLHTTHRSLCTVAGPLQSGTEASDLLLRGLHLIFFFFLLVSSVCVYCAGCPASTLKCCPTLSGLAPQWALLMTRHSSRQLQRLPLSYKSSFLRR